MSGTRMLLLVAVVIAAAAESGRAIAPDEGERGANDRPLLREGTRIPPTSGRFRRVGRRWEFVSDTADDLADALTQAEDARFEDARFEDARFGDTRFGDFRAGSAGAGNARNAPSRGGDDATTGVRRGSAEPPSQAGADTPAQSGNVPFGSVPFPTRGTNRHARPTSSAASPGTRDLPTDASSSVGRPGVPRMLVVENLMLQRIEEAVRDDPAANRWTVTGVVTEYQNENRLIVTTAERADAR